MTMHTLRGFDGLARVRRTWAFWGVVSLAMISYVALAQVAAQTVVTKVQLTPGDKVEVKLFRLSDDPLRFNLGFRATGCEQRPELGSWASTEKAGFLKLRPGAEVRIVATAPDSPAVTYEAMSLSAYCSDHNLAR